MLGNVLIAKYDDPGNQSVDVKINNECITNALVNLDVAINIMTKETMEKQGLTNLRQTPIVL